MSLVEDVDELTIRNGLVRPVGPEGYGRNHALSEGAGAVHGFRKAPVLAPQLFYWLEEPKEHTGFCCLLAPPSVLYFSGQWRKRYLSSCRAHICCYQLTCIQGVRNYRWHQRTEIRRLPELLGRNTNFHVRIRTAQGTSNLHGTVVTYSWARGRYYGLRRRYIFKNSQ